MLSLSLDTLLKVSDTTSPQKLFDYDCVTLYIWITCTSGCFAIINVFIDLRSSYHVRKFVSTCLLDWKTMRGTPYYLK